MKKFSFRHIKEEKLGDSLNESLKNDLYGNLSEEELFSKADFDELSQEEKAPEIRFGAPADNVEREAAVAVSDTEVDFESMDFVTETLAAIYADQGYYDKAIDAYAKLILLYPEKSTYFASLVNEIKSKN
jgi:tetratricopeptide (TPR) repeat protein